MTDLSAPSAPKNSLARVALILAILVPIAGAAAGHVALRQIASRAESGRGTAVAAIVIGDIGTVAWFVFWAVFLSALAGASGSLL